MAESQFGGLEVGNQITKFPGISKDRWVMVGEVIRIVIKVAIACFARRECRFSNKKMVGIFVGAAYGQTPLRKISWLECHS